MTAWKEFERLAETIYRELSPLAEVKWNDHIRGVDSEIDRQIDVSIRWTTGGQENLVVVQVKNWSDRADINAVGEFASVVRDVRAQGGIMVCKSGFSGNALRYAKNIGINLHNLYDAQSAEWKKVITLPVIWLDLSPHLKWSGSVHLDAGDSVEDSGLPLVFHENGTQVRVVDRFITEWNAGRVDRSPGLGHAFEIDSPMFMPVLTVGQGEQLREIREYWFSYSVARRSWLGRFSPDEWRGMEDYLSDSLVISHLPLGQVPVERGEDWEEVADPEKVILELRGGLVTSESLSIDGQGLRPDKTSIRYLGP